MRYIKVYTTKIKNTSKITKMSIFALTQQFI